MSGATTASAGRIAGVAVALDTPDESRFDLWCGTFGPRVEVLKVGLEAYVRWGERAVSRARSTGARVFLDLKLHDIPATMAGAAAAAADQGVDLLTVHAAAGRRALDAAVTAVDGRVGLLAVTVLTSLGPKDLEELDLPGTPGRRASAWAAVARAAGCAGVVCSPLEVRALRAELPRPFLLVTPGIRFGGATADDQRRVAGPRTALRDGADLLVVGRALTGAPDPGAALAALESELRRSGDPDQK